jgi:hypothetical protein
MDVGTCRNYSQVGQVGKYITLPELWGGGRGVSNFAGTLPEPFGWNLWNLAGTLPELCRNFSSMFLDKLSLVVTGQNMS